jgi:hypothetical protein
VTGLSAQARSGDQAAASPPPVGLGLISHQNIGGRWNRPNLCDFHSEYTLFATNLIFGNLRPYTKIVPLYAATQGFM